jgi:hypothetical protein
MKRTQGRVRGRGRADAGVVLVETAVALIFLGVLLIGITEYGFAWRQTTVVEKTVQQSARVAGNLANESLADYEALQAFRSLLGSSKHLTVDYVIVYKSTTADGALPDPDCTTASQPGVCNRYVAADLLRPAGDFGCGGAKPDSAWCPTGRVRDRSPSPDYVGVQARLTYEGLTGSVGSITIVRRGVYAIEPCAFGLPGC